MMKFVIYSAIVGVVFADFFQMNEKIIDAVENKLAEERGQPRNLGVLLGNNLNNIKDSGCWCYFNDNYNHGKGKPIDAIDELCRKLSEGYQCAIIDSGDPDCEPWSATYTVGFSAGIGNIENICTALNSNLCSRHACFVESIFVTNIIDQFLAGNVVPGHLIQNGFDFDGQCVLPNVPNTATGHAQDKACCGSFIDRYPYNSALKDCCGSLTYNPNVMLCCVDNIPRVSC